MRTLVRVPGHQEASKSQRVEFRAVRSTFYQEILRPKRIRDDSSGQSLMSAYAFTESERLRASFVGRAQRMVDAERVAELIVGASFIIASLALVLLGGWARSMSLPVVAL